MRLIQLKNTQESKIALVEEPNLRFIDEFASVVSLAQYCLNEKCSLQNEVINHLSNTLIDYQSVYNGDSEWKILCPVTHENPRNIMVTGTGLTHKASAINRQKMNEAAANNLINDSIKMYQLGVEGGKPEPGNIGVQPEWFYKGNGSVLKAHNEALLVPNYGNDGGEEPEIAAIYINDKHGMPYRIGFTTGNEFSDHVMEKKNYLYLAPSKIRTCSLGPELVIDESFRDLNGEVSIVRKNETIWKKFIKTGEENMAHNLENLEYHHFKYDNHRLPNDIHVHFFGTGAFSFGDGIKLEEGDLMTVKWEGMGRALINPLKIDTSREILLKAQKL